MVDALRDVEGALHDVANTLTVVLGWLDIATAQCEGRYDSASSALHIAREWAQQGRAIAREAIGAERGNDTPCPQVEEFVRSLVDGILPQFTAKGLRVSVAVDDTAASMRVPCSAQARQVLMNLLLNALAFASQGGAAQLEAASAPGEMVRFVVRDDGPGFSERQVAAGPQSLSTTRVGGTGIGLRHAHMIALRNGATLRIMRPGPGAEIELLWPQARHEVAPACRPASSATLAGKNIVVLEDDLAMWLLLETALEARGASLTLARNDGELQAALSCSSFDAALIDLSPLGERAAEVLERMSSSKVRPIRIVLMTGAARAPSNEVLSRTSAWVRKPFELSEIVDAILG